MLEFPLFLVLLRGFLYSVSPFVSLFQKRQKIEPFRAELERRLEEKAEECNRLQELLERRVGEAQQSPKE